MLKCKVRGMSMKNFLKDIVSLKQKEVEALKAKTPITHFVDSKRLLKGVRSFKEAITSGDGVKLIAEIKKKSPSRKRGFAKKFNVVQLAEIYAQSGAKAISVLTDKRFFGGHVLHLAAVRSAVNLPVLRKDFIVDEYQVYESRYHGADAILLIARILPKDKIKSFMLLAKKMGMDVIVEIHDEADLEKALLCNARIIGINNRNLDTFSVDIENTNRLASKMPKEIIKISESGIKDRNDILKLKKIGLDAVLIGETFLVAKDIALKVKEITGEANEKDQG